MHSQRTTNPAPPSDRVTDFRRRVLDPPAPVYSPVSAVPVAGFRAILRPCCSGVFPDKLAAMAPQTSTELILTLKNSLEHLREAVAGVAEEHGGISPGPGQWSAVECVEHLTIAEESMLRRLKTGEPLAEPVHLPDREAQMAASVSGRATRLQAPAAAVPTGRFASVAAAMDAFTAARLRTIEFVETGVDLRSMEVTHPFFGRISGYELAVIMAAHAVRHAAQIRETREHIGE